MVRLAKKILELAMRRPAKGVWRVTFTVDSGFATEEDVVLGAPDNMEKEFAIETLRQAFANEHGINKNRLTVRDVKHEKVRDAD